MVKKQIKMSQEDAARQAPENVEEDQAAEQVDIEALGKELAEAQAQCAEYLDKYRRSAAEFDNYRKRQLRDQERQSQQLTANVVRDLLPLADDLQRAVEHLPNANADESWVQGVVLIEQKLHKLLESYGVIAIEAKGQPFDPNVHESLFTEPNEEYPEGTVLEVYETGYRLGDLVVRPAKVKVSVSSGSDRATDSN